MQESSKNFYLLDIRHFYLLAIRHFYLLDIRCFQAIFCPKKLVCTNDLKVGISQIWICHKLSQLLTSCHKLSQLLRFVTCFQNSPKFVLATPHNLSPLLSSCHKNAKVIICKFLTEQTSVVRHSSITKGEQKDLERMQKVALGIILGQDYSYYENYLKITGLETLTSRRTKCWPYFW